MPFKGYKQTEEHIKKRTKVHKGKILSKETRKKISNSKKGTITSEKTKQKLSKAMKGNFWGGNNIKLKSGNERARKIFPIVKPCEICNSTNKVMRHHKDENPLNNNPNNIQWLCHKCHSKVHKYLRLKKYKQKIKEKL